MPDLRPTKSLIDNYAVDTLSKAMLYRAVLNLKKFAKRNYTGSYNKLRDIHHDIDFIKNSDFAIHAMKLLNIENSDILFKLIKFDITKI